MVSAFFMGSLHLAWFHMFRFFSFTERSSLALAQWLCVAVVFWTAWPALQQPRIEGDDFRYLHGIQQLSADYSRTVLDAALVENRWDHLWFMNEDGRIRFFRPTVAASYALDWKVWGNRYAFGLTLTNVLIHLGCCLLVAFLLHRWLGRGWPAIMASILFAGLWSHGECIWYIAGRTDSLAAFGFLGAFALHISGRSRLRWWAILCFSLGFLTKELVVAAPLVFMAHDILVDRKRPEWKLYTTYALVTGLVLGLKQLALGAASSDFFYPYLISPLRPDFIEHLWLQARSYSANLVLAQVTAPFSDRETVSSLNSIAGVVLAGGSLVVGGILLQREGRFWALLLLGGATWLPTSFVYLSERYLYLPSVAFVGLLGLLIATRPPRWRNGLALALGIYAVFHAVQLNEKHRMICEQPGSIREMAAQLKPIQGQIVPGSHLLLVNVPGSFLRAQFMEETLRILFDDPSLTAQVLTMMPGQDGTVLLPGDPPPNMGSGVVLKQIGARKLTITGRGGQRVQEYERFPFAWASLESDREYQAPMFKARILSGEARGATAIEFSFPEPVDQYQILVWEANPDFTQHPWNRRANAHVRLEP